MTEYEIHGPARVKAIGSDESGPGAASPRACVPSGVKSLIHGSQPVAEAQPAK